MPQSIHLLVLQNFVNESPQTEIILEVHLWPAGPFDDVNFNSENTTRVVFKP